MKGQATFDADIWLESWFRPLPMPVKLLWFFLHSECDRAGWWNPDPDLVQVRFKSELDLKAAAQALAGQVIVHASGWWELTHYIATAYPKGLSQSNPMHKHVASLVARHHVREARAGEVAPASPSLPSGLDPQPLNNEGVDNSGQTVARVGGEPDPGQALPRAYADPAQGLKVNGDGSKAPGVGCQVSGVEFQDGGGSREGGQSDYSAASVGREAVLMRFRAAGSVDEPAWALVGLLEALKGQNGHLVDGGARLYLAHAAGPNGHSLAGFIRALSRWLLDAKLEAKSTARCQHPRKRWMTKAADDFECGFKVRWFTCEDCGYHAADENSAYMPEHDHEWGDVVHGRTFVLDDEGRAQQVESYVACRLCPTRIDARAVAA